MALHVFCLAPTGKQLSLKLFIFSPTDGKTAFCVFLKSEFSEENIEFWTACEDFRMHTSQEELLTRANSIYEEFVKSEAPKEVTHIRRPLESLNWCLVLTLSAPVWPQINLDFHTKNAIVQSLHEPNVNIFLAAQRKVYGLMENNSYPRFIHSDLYRELCNRARKQSRHIRP